MHRTHVGVLRGGPSHQYDISLKSGANVLRHLDAERYAPVDIFIDRAVVWHVRGLPTEPRRALSHLDVVINALHGVYGEDGTVQKILDAVGVPYVGTTALGSALAMQKHAAKNAIRQLNIKLPRHVLVGREADSASEAIRIFRTLAQPVVVKPAASGSSIGVSVSHGVPAIEQAIAHALQVSPQALVEEYISGREVTCGVLERFREKDVYTFPPVEIVTQTDPDFFNYEAKCGGVHAALCPSSFSHEIKRELEVAARQVHETLGLRHYSRSDFIVTPRRGIYFLEANTSPDISDMALYPYAAASVGCTFGQLLDHLIRLAQARK